MFVFQRPFRTLMPSSRLPGTMSPANFRCRVAAGECFRPEVAASSVLKKWRDARTTYLPLRRRKKINTFKSPKSISQNKIIGQIKAFLTTQERNSSWSESASRCGWFLNACCAIWNSIMPMALPTIRYVKIKVMAFIAKSNYLNFAITRSKALRPSSSLSISGPKLMRQ